MTKKEAIRQTQQENALLALGFTRAEAEQLRRISMTLHRWFELECGDGNDYGSWAIERDDNGDGPPFMVHHHYLHGRGKDYTTRTKIADRETGARKRLAAIVDRCNRARREATTEINGKTTLAPQAPLSYYVQTDPRGASLYIIRPGDVPDGASVESWYNRGLCIY